MPDTRTVRFLFPLGATLLWGSVRYVIAHRRYTEWRGAETLVQYALSAPQAPGVIVAWVDEKDLVEDGRVIESPRATGDPDAL